MDVSAPGPDERNWSVAAHLSGLVGYIIPFGWVIGPLVVWLMKRDQLPMVADQGREALNFQITVLIMGAVAGILVLVGIGILILPLVGIYQIVLMIVAAIKASEGVLFRYPLTLRLVN